METLSLNIDSMAYGGRGVARVNKRVIFVAGALPGESVKAAITAEEKNFAEAVATEILAPSPSRIPPTCPYAFTAGSDRIWCPGCRYQHAVYKEEIAFKQAQLDDLLTRLGKQKTPTILPPIPSPVEMNYRNKLTFHCLSDEQKKNLGYFSEDNRSVLDITSCPLGVKPLNDLLARLRKDQAFMATFKDHMSLTLRYTEKDGAVFWQDDQSAGADLTEIIPEAALSVPRASFFQVNPAVASMLTKQVTAFITGNKPVYLIDLYCGVGVFALSAAKTGVPRVVGVELDGKAVEAANRNTQALDLKNVSFMAISASRSITRLLREAVRPAETMLIADPPRRGLDKEVIQAICKFKPGCVIYVSCAPDTLARDIALLTHGGYTLKHSQAFDMFPRTQYFETVALLEL